MLGKKNYGEADRILILFSRHFGKLYLLAKGVRKVKSRKRGHIEVFSYIKFSAVKARGLDLLTEVELIDSYSFIRKNLKKVSLAFYFMEVLNKITEENQQNKDLFDRILFYLDRLKSENRLKQMRLQFIEDVLSILGFWPKKKKITGADRFLGKILEREINSIRIGKKLLM